MERIAGGHSSAELPILRHPILAVPHSQGDEMTERIALGQLSVLAVLPLENLSADPAQEYFADGMTDELITMLAKNTELRVVSRTSVMQYKKVHRPLADVARELGVDGILEGSVARSGSRVHINTQLIYAPQDRHVWAERLRPRPERSDFSAKRVGANHRQTSRGYSFRFRQSGEKDQTRSARRLSVGTVLLVRGGLRKEPRVLSESH
jgi:TolB-like protein